MRTRTHPNRLRFGSRHLGRSRPAVRIAHSSRTPVVVKAAIRTSRSGVESDACPRARTCPAMPSRNEIGRRLRLIAEGYWVGPLAVITDEGLVQKSRCMRTPSLVASPGDAPQTLGIPCRRPARAGRADRQPAQRRSHLPPAGGGRDPRRRRASRRVDTWTFTAAGTPWTDQQWGAQVILAAVYQVGGWTGLVVLRAALIGVIFGCLFAIGVRRGLGMRRAAWLTLAAFLVSAVALGSAPATHRDGAASRSSCCS